MSPTIVVLSVDLIDRSKLSAAFPEATLVRSASAVVEAAAEAELVIVDLNRSGALDAIGAAAATGARVVAFGSHVDDDKLTAATEAGAETLARSVFFRRLADGTL